MNLPAEKTYESLHDLARQTIVHPDEFDQSPHVASGDFYVTVDVAFELERLSQPYRGVRKGRCVREGERTSDWRREYALGQGRRTVASFALATLEPRGLDQRGGNMYGIVVLDAMSISDADLVLGMKRHTESTLGQPANLGGGDRTKFLIDLERLAT